MIKKTTLILSVLMALLSMQAKATDIYTYLAPSYDLVQQFQGAQKITFDATGMNVTTADGQTTALAFDKFNYFSFTEKIPVGIKGVNGKDAGVALNGNTLSVNGASAVTIYTAAGVQVARAEVSADGVATYNMASLPAGIYIVKAVVNGKATSVKVIRK
ncbi:MAG: T9SS type A sorting domain-containing protein [Bacteroidaceae bacterium]|nr:T9SS type A sorting domain-containing protein [Bacteroidaceae bacterium]